MKMPEGEGINIQVSLLYGGVSGSLGVIATLDPQNFDFFLKVQKSINKVVRGIGEFKHEKFREFWVEKKNSSSHGIY